MAKGKKITYTQAGYQKLIDELHYLKLEKREKIKNDIAVARSFGDLSENSEYDEARNEQAKNEARIKELEELVGARTGDKTLMDTLTPAVAALEKAGQEGADMQTALVQMKKAAESGRDSTKDMIAKFGRAKSLLERAIGHQDAGATSVWLIFQGMREYVEDKME